MIKSKLFEILGSFDPSEWKEFDGYLKFMKGEKTEEYRLYRYIYKYRDQLDHHKLAAEQVIMSLFKDKDRKNFLNLMSRLGHHSMEYLGYRQYETNMLEKRLLRQMAFQERGLHKLAIKEKKLLDAEIDRSLIDAWSGYYKLRAQHTLKYSANPYRHNDREGLIKELLSDWLSFRSDLDYYYEVDMEHNCKIWNLTLHEEVSLIDSASYKSGSENPLQWLYLYKKDDDQKSYEKLLLYLKESAFRLTPSFGMFLMQHLVQKEGGLIRDGVRSPANMAYLYHLSGEYGWLLVNGKMTHRNLNLMIHSACFDEDRDLASRYLKKWSAYLPDEVKEETILLNEATILFYHGHYEAVLEKLRSWNFQKKANKNSSRALLLMTYYKWYQNDVDFVNNQVNNYVSYINRLTESSASYKEGCLAFAKVIKLLLAGDVYTVKNMILSDQPMIRKSWLRSIIK